MPSMDVFSADHLSLVELLGLLDEVPHVPGRTGELGLFETDSIATTTGFIDAKNGVVNLIGTSARGTDGQTVAGDTRNAYPVSSVRLAAHAQINAAEVQNLRAFGTESELETVQSLVRQRMAPPSRSIDATLEWHRVQCVTQGIITDTDGSTLLNLYALMGKTKPGTVFLDLLNSSPSEAQIRKIFTQLARDIEDELGGTPYERLHGYAGSLVFDALTEHPELRVAFERQQDGAYLRQGMARRSVTYGGITIEEYRGNVDGTPFVAEGEICVFPVGVPGLFKTVWTPGDRMEVVNTLGLAKYAFLDRDVKDRFVEIEVQSNPINYCSRPMVLRTLNGGTSGTPM